MQIINIMWTIVLSFIAIVGYWFYSQHFKRKNESLLEISKRSDWVEPVLEASKEEQLEENIVDDIILPILERKQTKSKKAPKAQLMYGYDVLTIYIMAHPNRPFQGYELLQAISVNGFHYGKMRIFHQHKNPLDVESPILFSLANAMEPGFFNLSEMGSFSCNGLILFMHADTRKDLVDDFYLMLDTAAQLADDLGGEVLDDTRNPLDVNSEKRYLARLGVVSTTE